MRKVLMLVAMVLLTASAGWSGGTVSTYCEGTCDGSVSTVVYICGLGVSGPTCCSRARRYACNGGEFVGTCTEPYGTLLC